MQPLESLTVKGNYNIFWTMENYTVANSKSWVGHEVDLQATWDYTEDVSFGLLASWFIPGEVYTIDDKTATDLVGTMKVSF